MAHLLEKGEEKGKGRKRNVKKKEKEEKRKPKKKEDGNKGGDVDGGEYRNSGDHEHILCFTQF